MYTRIVQVGDFLELYKYEKNPLPPRIRRKSQCRYPVTKRRRNNLANSKRLFKNIIVANLSTSPAFLTLTMADIVPVETAYALLTVFFRILKTKVKELRYIAVPEFQKRGAVHFHVLIWGLPQEAILHERYSRNLQNLWLYGYVDIVGTDGSEKLSTYLAKYLSKTMLDVRLRGRKAYSCSRNVVRPVRLNTETSVAWALEEFSLVNGGDNNVVEVSRGVYDTKWLGRCDFTRFKVLR